MVFDLRFHTRLQLRVQFWIFTKFPLGLCRYANNIKPYLLAKEYSKDGEDVRGVIGLIMQHYVIKRYQTLSNVM